MSAPAQVTAPPTVSPFATTTTAPKEISASNDEQVKEKTVPAHATEPPVVSSPVPPTISAVAPATKPATRLPSRPAAPTLLDNDAPASPSSSKGSKLSSSAVSLPAGVPAVQSALPAFSRVEQLWAEIMTWKGLRTEEAKIMLQEFKRVHCDFVQGAAIAAGRVSLDQDEVLLVGKLAQIELQEDGELYEDM